jgi:hypothetical protein
MLSLQGFLRLWSCVHSKEHFYRGVQNARSGVSELNKLSRRDICNVSFRLRIYAMLSELNRLLVEGVDRAQCRGQILKDEDGREEDDAWETMSRLSISTNSLPFNPSDHCKERQLLRGITALQVQRAKLLGHKESLGNIMLPARNFFSHGVANDLKK